jgi:glycosyltransferase involved in cell wall biosynthesis
MSALEASAFGRPVVCSGHGGLTEIVADGKTGFFVAPRNPAQLAEALARLAHDRALLASMGAAAHRRARDEFSQKVFIDRFVALLERPDAPA